MPAPDLLLRLSHLGRQGLGRIPWRPGLPRRPLTLNEAHRAFLAASPLPLSSATQVVDVGPASWFYLAALAEACPKAQVSGVEVDPYRRFRDGYRRIDHARAQIRAHSPNANYLTGDFLSPRIQSWYGGLSGVLTTFFFPLVFPATARSWGLPGSWVRWEAQLGRALEQSVVVLVAHADRRELEVTLRLLEGSAHRASVAAVQIAAWSGDPVWVVSVQ